MSLLLSAPFLGERVALFPLGRFSRAAFRPPPQTSRNALPPPSQRVTTATPRVMATTAEGSSKVLEPAAIIWLHGLGDSGAGWAEIRSQFREKKFSHIDWSFPNAPNQKVTCNGGYVMPSWFDMPQIPVTEDSPNFDSSVLQAVRSIHSLLDKKVEAGVDPSRILLGGFSQGGALTVASTLLYPRALAGAVVFSGWVPLSGDNLTSGATEESKKVPLLWCHGEDDQVVYFSAGKAGPPALKALGVSQCDFKSYEGMAHSSCPEEMADLRAFIEKRLPPTS
eukprot:TRINITY_DN18629_c0_g1_i1.p1 TRINITY_DN18629_c0_g1~~TRINITY_DN18629_c0_g1_i1.p1  ORF type:complete len:316 (+),score=37.32 TRINITY_DN18629_c0_g1_i1:111-950(+)